MFGKRGKTTVTRSTPERYKERVGYIFRGGVTIPVNKAGDVEIVIDSGLSPQLQEVYLEHEQAQLRVIREEGPRYGPSILPTAHFRGLGAGYEKAKELGVESEYRRHRGEREG